MFENKAGRHHLCETSPRTTNSNQNTDPLKDKHTLSIPENHQTSDRHCTSRQMNQQPQRTTGSMKPIQPEWIDMKYLRNCCTTDKAQVAS